ncbi:hypothetical protein [Algicola sagamiensis]|uniref:hypothetical protein n=1 Tax=Algicola sagamiensis TaxID=163869 RepID=UPI0003819CA3|nr:hypothetical protein [Algicola sagamiensis]
MSIDYFLTFENQIHNFLFGLLILTFLLHRKDDSFLSTIVVLCLISFMGIAVSPSLLEVSSKPHILSKLAWHGSHALIVLFGIGLLQLLHEQRQITIGIYGKVVIHAYAIIIILHCIRFMVKAVIGLQSTIFRDIYQYGIFGINIFVVVIGLVGLFAITFQKIILINQSNIEVKTWSDKPTD